MRHSWKIEELAYAELAINPDTTTIESIKGMLDICSYVMVIRQLILVLLVKNLLSL